jgi:Na+-transporting NADH:ubiquinone oxidoreductase subunit NqrC
MEIALLVATIVLVAIVVAFALYFVNVTIKDKKEITHQNMLLIATMIDEESKRKFIVEEIQRKELNRHEDFVEKVSDEKLRQTNKEIKDSKVENKIKFEFETKPTESLSARPMPGRKIETEEIEFEDAK